jgi:hypothetical protein
VEPPNVVSRNERWLLIPIFNAFQLKRSVLDEKVEEEADELVVSFARFPPSKHTAQTPAGFSWATTPSCTNQIRWRH